MEKIRVKTAVKNYDVIINDKEFSKLNDELKNRKLSKRVFVLIDKNVDNRWGNAIRKQIIMWSEKLHFHIYNPDERRKNEKSLTKIYSTLLNKGFGRDTLFITIGGGITGDLGGFAAATYMRGIQLVHVPTTILAAVDSSIGGKTGINFSGYKNIVGSFYQPDLVFIHPDFFRTLPKPEIKCGMGEIVKYAVLSDKKTFSFIDKNFSRLLTLDKKILFTAIKNCVEFKAKVVESDERELELRKILNLGHTFAHAYETVSKFKLKHGEAVTCGIATAAILSEKLKMIEPKSFLKIISLCSKLKINSRLLVVQQEKMMNALNMDKKKESGVLKFILPVNIGETAVGVEAPIDLVLASIDESILLYKKLV